MYIAQSSCFFAFLKHRIALWRGFTPCCVLYLHAFVGRLVETLGPFCDLHGPDHLMTAVNQCRRHGRNNGASHFWDSLGLMTGFRG